MANRIEAIRNYLGSVANRTLGRQAWREAMRQPNESYSYTYTERQPTWAKSLNRALYQAAVPYAALEFIAPVTSRVVFPIVEGREANQVLQNDYLNTGLMLPALITDVSTNMFAIFVGRNSSEVIILKLAANAATHVSLDFIGAAAKRVRNFRPSGTTLAV